MKKFIAIAMASAMTVSALAGCASNGTAGNNDNTKTESTETAQYAALGEKSLRIIPKLCSFSLIFVPSF